MKHLPTFIKTVQAIKLNRDQKRSLLLVLLLLFTVLYPIFEPSHANAAVATAGLLRIDRMGVTATTGTATGGTVCMKPSATHTSSVTSVVVTFPGTGTVGATSFGVNTTAANWTVTTTNMPVFGGVTATAWPTIATATSVSGASVTFGSTTATLTAGIYYCFNFSGTSTLATTTAAASNLTGTISATDAGGNETTAFATATVASGTDQIAVTATVGSTFSFTQTTGGPATLGALNSTGATSAPATAVRYTVATNARSGWIAWMKSTGQGGNAVLYSTNTTASIGGTAYAAGQAIIDLATLAGSNYVVDCQPGTGAGCFADFAGNAGYTSGGRPSVNFVQFASDGSQATADTFDFKAIARVSATQAAATDYAGTLTIVAAGQF